MSGRAGRGKRARDLLVNNRMGARSVAHAGAARYRSRENSENQPSDQGGGPRGRPTAAERHPIHCATESRDQTPATTGRGPDEDRTSDQRPKPPPDTPPTLIPGTLRPFQTDTNDIYIYILEPGACLLDAQVRLEHHSERTLPLSHEGPQPDQITVTFPSFDDKQPAPLRPR